MNITRLLILFSLLFLYPFFKGFGQSVPPPDPILPNQIPPPADAASLGKYGDIPLNMSSGVPNISIPLYQIKTSKLSLPITLNYDASGIKVDQIAGWTGMQWAMEAGGVITRTVNAGDDLAGGYLSLPVPPDASTYQENDQASWQYLDNASQNISGGDTQPDYFFYNFSGHSGQFVFGEDKQIIDIHHNEPLKIQYSSVNGSVFTILDGNGNQYFFTQTQFATTGLHGGVAYISSWYLTKIRSCDQTDSIQFTYAADVTFQEVHRTYGLSITNTEIYRLGSKTTTDIVTTTGPMRLQNITFKNGKIVFYGSGPRTDVPELKLDSLVISRYDPPTASYVPLRTVKLTYGYYGSGANTRLRLDAVQTTGAVNEDGGLYHFVYNSSALPALTSTGKDLFNYYNGQDGNTTLVPDSVIDPTQKTQSGVVGGIRTTHNSFMQAGILQTLYYPTGGYTTFTFEPNMYAGVAGGGLRVSGIKNYDSSGAFLTGDLYKYGISESGFGIMPKGPATVNLYHQLVKVFNGVESESGCTPSITDYNVYTDNSLYNIFNLNSQAIYYQEVAKYRIDAAGNFLGKTVYDYDVYTVGPTVTGGGFGPSYYLVNSGFNGGNITAQEDFAYQSGAFEPLKKIVYNYNKIPGPSGRTFWAKRQMNMKGCFTAAYRGDVEHTWGDYLIYSGTVQLASTITTDFDISDPAKTVTSTATNLYDGAANLQPTTITNDLSDGTTLTTILKYPEESSSIPNLTPTQLSALNQMVTMHNLTTLVQKSVTRAGSPVSLVKNDFKIWSTNHVYLDTIEMQAANYPIENRAVFLNYDSAGNLQQDALYLAPHNSYIWDYNNQYPIAESKNSPLGSTAYTSFEANGTGNWTISSPLRSPLAFSGKQSYPLNGNTISKSGLSASTSYVVSYWTTAASPLAITGTVTGFPLQGPTLNGWTYYEHRVTGQTVITLTANTAINIDEVRLYPYGALMTTYTYDPLVGITSKVDAKSEITYFEYDGLQRLMNVRDKDKNIIKSYCYNFAGDAGDCFINKPSYTNAEQDVPFMTACAPADSGSTVTYKVAAGAYVSNISQQVADSLATADVTRNGQNYATQNGTCTLMINFALKNTTSEVYQINFTNTSFNQTYNFLVNGASSSVRVPAGTYTVNITPAGAHVTRTFEVGSLTVSGTTASFPGVNVNTGSSTLNALIF